MFSSVFLFCPTPEISPLAPCSISHHFQTMHYCLLNSFFWRTFRSIFYAFVSTQAQLLPAPRIKIRAGTRAFSVSVPTLWNSLSEYPSPFENSLFHTCLSFLSFHCIRSCVDVLGASLSSIRGYWRNRSFVIIISSSNVIIYPVSILSEQFKAVRGSFLNIHQVQLTWYTMPLMCPYMCVREYMHVRA